MTVHPRSLAIDEPRPSVPEWVCSECRRVVSGPWHDCSVPEREVGS